MALGPGRAYSRALNAVSIVCLCGGLAGCLAAAPLMPLLGVGMAAASGFEMYKVVQLGSGGKAQIEFPGKDGKTAPPPPMPHANRVAVWPDDQAEVYFAERLAAAGKQVSSPATVSAVLASGNLPTKLKQMTESDIRKAIAAVCRKTHAELVFASRDGGAVSNTNAFSFSSANVTDKVELVTYGCATNAAVWQDEMVLVVEVGGKTPSTTELNRVAADAWADRVLQAMGAPASKNSQ